MKEALKEAKIAFDKGEVPVGAIIIHNNKIIARAHNQRELLKDPTAHAEMIAITQAANFLENWRLKDTTIYVTIEPCPMCAGAILEARMERIVFGAEDLRGGGCGSVINVINNRIPITAGVLEKECQKIMSDFFKRRRIKDKI